MNPLKYYLGKIIMWPLLPVMFWQAGRIWNGMPKLPEANADLVGHTGVGNKELKVLAIGESTIAGVGVDSHRKGIAGSFASFLAKQLEAVVHWKVVAKTGVTAEEANELLIPKLESQPTNLILIGLGGNDAFRRHSPSKWVADVKQLIQNIRKIHPTAPIVFLNMPPVREFPAFTRLIQFFIGNLVELLGDELAKAVQQFQNVWFFEERITYQHWLNPDGQNPDKGFFFSDGVHPSEPTYKIWGNKLGKYVVDNIPLSNDQ